MDTNEAKAGKLLVYIVSQELALAFGYCRDTVHRHLKELCERGILLKELCERGIQRLPHKAHGQHFLVHD